MTRTNKAHAVTWAQVTAVAALLLASLGAAAAPAQDAQPPAGGAEQAEPAEQAEAPGRRPPRGRLPAYYARVVSQEQRTEIYALQAKFNAQIEELRKQLDMIAEQRDKEVRDVLTPEQKKQVDDMVAAARARRAQAGNPPPPADDS